MKGWCIGYKYPHSKGLGRREGYKLKDRLFDRVCKVGFQKLIRTWEQHVVEGKD